MEKKRLKRRLAHLNRAGTDPLLLHAGEKRGEMEFSPRLQLEPLLLVDHRPEFPEDLELVVRRSVLGDRNRLFVCQLSEEMVQRPLGHDRAGVDDRNPAANRSASSI